MERGLVHTVTTARPELGQGSSLGWATSVTLQHPEMGQAGWQLFHQDPLQTPSRLPLQKTTGCSRRGGGTVTTPSPLPRPQRAKS